MPIKDELLEELLKDYKNPEDLLGKNGLLKELTKRLLEKAMETELTYHLGYEKHSPAVKKSGNSRNGKSAKTLKGDFGEMPIEIPPGPQRRFQSSDHPEVPDEIQRLRR